MLRSLLAVVVLALCAGVACATVNLNTATKDELIALPGIGPAKAQAILDYRAQHGAFKRVEELKDVKGIGAKRFEALRPELSLGSPARATGKGDKAEAKTAARGDIKVAAEPKPHK